MQWENLTSTAFQQAVEETETCIVACGGLEKHSEHLPLGRMQDVPNSFLGISWYANYPDHYAGDARSATKETGEALREISVSTFAKFLKAVKDDTVAPMLEKEFYSKTDFS